MRMSEVQLCGVCKNQVEEPASKIDLFGQQYKAHETCSKLVEEYQKTEEYKSQFFTVTKYSYSKGFLKYELIHEKYWKLIRKWIEKNPKVLVEAMGDIRIGQPVVQNTNGKVYAMPARGGMGLRGYTISSLIVDDIIVDKPLAKKEKKEKKKVNKRSKKIIRKGRFQDFETKIKANWDDPDYEMDKQNKVRN